MITIKVAKIDEQEPFNISVDKGNYIIVRNLIEQEKRKIIDKLKRYKSAGLIGSIFYPRNKTMQNELNDLVKKKRILTESLEKINKIF